MPLLAASLWLLTPIPALAVTCENPLQWEAAAYIGGLSEDQKHCLELRLLDTDPEVRAQISFMLIVHAYMKGNSDEYAERMRTHLSQYHTKDPEVAYLYATWKRDRSEFDEELIQWAKIAMEGRYRWVSNPSNYVKMVQSLYDMLNEACLVTTAEAQKRYEASPTEANKALFEALKQRARYYLIVSGPCLYKGDCLPHYEVEVEGAAPCSDLYELSDRAERGRVTPDELACLRAKYRRTGSNKRKVLDVMAENAQHDVSGRQWQTLMEWFHNATGTVEPNLAYEYSLFLRSQGARAAQDAITWADLALSGEDLKGGDAARARLYELRVEAARELVAWPAEEADAAGAPRPEEAAALLKQVEGEKSAWCAEHTRECKGP